MIIQPPQNPPSPPIHHEIQLQPVPPPHPLVMITLFLVWIVVIVIPVADVHPAVVLQLSIPPLPALPAPQPPHLPPAELAPLDPPPLEFDPIRTVDAVAIPAPLPTRLIVRLVRSILPFTFM